MEFDFEFAPLNDKLMQVTVSNNHREIPVIPELTKGKYLATTRIDIVLPTQITLKFSGKNQNTDTVVDQAGNILKDLTVKIKTIRLDGMIVNQNFLHNCLILTAQDNSTWIGSIVGFNGTMNINLDKNNVFSQFVSFINR